MKKLLFALTVLLLLPTVSILQAQNASFKIVNKTSSIIKSDKITIMRDGEHEDAFITEEIIKYNYLDLIRIAKEAEKDNLKHGLDLNSRRVAISTTTIDSSTVPPTISTTSTVAPLFNKDTVDARNKRIKNLEKELASIDDQQDSLYYIYTKDYLNYRNALVLSFGALRSRAFFDILYNAQGTRFKAMGNAGISFGNNTGAVYSEIVNGNLGLFRVSLGTMIAKTTGDTSVAKKAEAYQRLVTYGGNTVLNLEYPLAYIHSDNNQYNFVSRLVAKGTADLPAFGTNTESWAGSGSLGIDFYGDASIKDGSFRFFFDFNFNGIYGTDVFRDNLGINKAHFTFGQLSLGVVFLQNFKISVTLATISSEDNLRNRHVVAGGQVLR